MPHDHISDPAAASAAILDSAEATARVLGDGALYLRMLRRFQHDHPAGASPVRAALASADSALAHRLAHTLKGSAGMIGAHRLHGCAARLEQRLRTDGAAAASSDLLLLEQAMGDVLLAIGALVDGVASVPRATAAALATGPAVAAATLLLDQLDQLLDMGDGAAIDLLERGAATIKNAIGSVAFSEVMLAANAFDFEAALASVRRARSGLAHDPVRLAKE
ncbi:Hpt domain-containing protein [Massilia sp. PWRC2]|uniref:Hpt domain-containing protein n=1 Tax=Massilia sp. PWRC2 TaxID=2804626 RepID=UPI003CF8D59F